jgi:hypothetical protein
VFDVRFVPAVDSSAHECVVVVGAAIPAGARRVLQYPADSGVSGAGVGAVLFGESSFLDPRLCRRSLVERAARISCDVGAAGLVMAADAKMVPIWAKELGDAEVDRVGVAAPMLSEGEALRDHFSPGRFVALLPLVHFLRDALAAGGSTAWKPPPLRATFIVDDPNLRRRTYGPLDYRRLAADAAEHGYHVGVATIPLDARAATPAVARIFREHGDVLSLSIHGNDHDGGELGKQASRDHAAQVLAQAVRRIRRLEERNGLAVSRVMVPPHEACTPQVLSLLMLLGFDGVCMTRPHPWISLGEQSSPYATTEHDVDAGWAPAVMQADGFPVFLRRQFSETDEIVLNAYLNQPLIFYGHISDLVRGLAPLRSTAAAINSLGRVRWCSLGDLAASNYMTARPANGRLLVKPFARRVVLSDIAETDEVEILWPTARDGRVRVNHLQDDGRSIHVQDYPAHEPLRLRQGAAAVDATFVPNAAIDSASIARRRTAARALVRRTLTEARDRTLPRLDARRGSS